MRSKKGLDNIFHAHYAEQNNDFYYDKLILLKKELQKIEPRKQKYSFGKHTHFLHAIKLKLYIEQKNYIKAYYNLEKLYCRSDILIFENYNAIMIALKSL